MSWLFFWRLGKGFLQQTNWIWQLLLFPFGSNQDDNSIRLFLPFQIEVILEILPINILNGGIGNVKAIGQVCYTTKPWPFGFSQEGFYNKNNQQSTFFIWGQLLVGGRNRKVLVLGKLHPHPFLFVFLPSFTKPAENGMEPLRRGLVVHFQKPCHDPFHSRSHFFCVVFLFFIAQILPKRACGFVLCCFILLCILSTLSCREKFSSWWCLESFSLQQNI